MCESDVYEIDFKGELEKEIQDMEKVMDFIYYSGYFLLEEVREFERYMKKQRDLITYLK